MPKRSYAQREKALHLSPNTGPYIGVSVLPLRPWETMTHDRDKPCPQCGCLAIKTPIECPRCGGSYV